MDVSHFTFMRRMTYIYITVGPQGEKPTLSLAFSF